MLIATFGPTTGWAGKTITREGDVFTLEGHGPITPTDVMEYDRQGQLTWAAEGTRAWVGSLITHAETASTSSPIKATPPSPAANAADSRPLAASRSSATGDLIGSFCAGSLWESKQVRFNRGELTLQGVGPIAPSALLAFDERGYIEWVSEAQREWVQLMSIASPSPVVTQGWSRYSIFWQVLAALAVFYVALVILGLILISGTA